MFLCVEYIAVGCLTFQNYGVMKMKIMVLTLVMLNWVFNSEQKNLNFPSRYWNPESSRYGLLLEKATNCLLNTK